MNCVILLLIGIFFSSIGNPSFRTSNNNIFQNCTTQKLEKIINGHSMQPMLKNGEKIILIENFYKCTKKSPQKGDLIAYQYGGSQIPLIKKIVAGSKDTVYTKNNTLFVNNIEVKNSQGDSYNFSPPEINMLNLYISEKNTIPHDTYFVLGDNIYNSIDSRKFGAISQENFLGKFKRKK